MRKAGVYSITNMENAKVYIGSTVNLKKRWEYHRQDLQRGDHVNPHLQSSWNKYGKNAFEFGVLEYLIDLEELHLAEQFWCEIYQLEGKELYNIGTPGRAPGLGRPCSVETRRKISESHKGKKHSEETRRKMSESARNRPPISEETRCRISESKRGRPVSEETRCRISKALKGRKLSEEDKCRIRELRKNSPPSMLGRKHSEETKRKMSKAAMGRTFSEETRRKIGDGNRGKTVSEETRQKISATLKARWAKIKENK